MVHDKVNFVAFDILDLREHVGAEVCWKPCAKYEAHHAR